MTGIKEKNMKFLTRKLVTHEDLNPRGYLHGGQLLKWIDEEGGIHAGLEMNTGLIVTKMMSEIDFKFPVILGDVIEIGMKTLEIGQTSCTLSCEVRSLHADRPVLTIDKIVYVRVNKYALELGLQYEEYPPFHDVHNLYCTMPSSRYGKEYSVKNFHARNKIIAGTSDVVAAFIPEGGMSDGTFSTLKYAKKLNKKRIIIS